MEKVTFKFSPGQEVRSTISGIEGTINGVLIKKNGNKQLSVQPKSTNGMSKPDSWFIDEYSLEVVDSGIPLSFDVEFLHSPGSKAKDSVSGIKGTILCAICWINGCKTYSLQPKAKKNKKRRPNYFMCDEEDIIILKSNEEKRKVSNTGGPSIKGSYFL